MGIELEEGGCHVYQLARYHPRGLWGRVYWFSVAPFHRLVFPGLLAGIARDAETAAAGNEDDVSRPLAASRAASTT